jgi:hypothetical protein
MGTKTMSARAYRLAVKNIKHHITWAKETDQAYIGDSTVRREDLEQLLARVIRLERALRAIAAHHVGMSKHTRWTGSFVRSWCGAALHH